MDAPLIYEESWVRDRFLGREGRCGARYIVPLVFDAEGNCTEWGSPPEPSPEKRIWPIPNIEVPK